MYIMFHDPTLFATPIHKLLGHFFLVGLIYDMWWIIREQNWSKDDVSHRVVFHQVRVFR